MTFDSARDTGRKFFLQRGLKKGAFGTILGVFNMKERQ